MNTSKYKNIILNTLREHPVHPNVYELYQLVKAKYPNIGMATVYRNLDALAESGEVLKFDTGSHFDRYDGTTAKHYHMVCTECNNVIDIPHEALKDIDTKVSEFTGHEITGHNLIFRGICKECVKKQNNIDKEEKQ